MALRTSISPALDGELEKLFWAAKLSISCKNPSLITVEELRAVISPQLIDYVTQTNEKLLDVLMATEREDLIHLLVNFVTMGHAENIELISKLIAKLELINPAFNPKTGMVRTVQDYLYDLHANPTENLHQWFERVLKKNPHAINELFEIADITQAGDNNLPLIRTVNALGYAVRFNTPRTVVMLLDAGAQLTASIVTGSVHNQPVFQYLLSAHLNFLMQNEILVAVISKIMTVKEPSLNKKEQIQLLLAAAASAKIDLTDLERKKLLANAVKYQPSVISLLLEWDKRFVTDLGKDQLLLHEAFSAISRLPDINEQIAVCSSLIPLISDWVGVLKNYSLTHYLLQRNPSVKTEMEKHVNDVDDDKKTCLTDLVAGEETPEQIAQLKFLLSLHVGDDTLNEFYITALQNALKNRHYVFVFYLMQANLLKGPKDALAQDNAIEALELRLKCPEMVELLKDKLAQVRRTLCEDRSQFDDVAYYRLTSVKHDSKLAKTLSIINERFSCLDKELKELEDELTALASSGNMAEVRAKLLELKSQGFVNLEEVPLLQEVGLYKAILELREEAFANARCILEQKDSDDKDGLLEKMKRDTNFMAKFVLDAMSELGYLKQDESECFVQSSISSVGLFGKPPTLRASATLKNSSSSSFHSSSSSSSDSSSASEDESNAYSHGVGIG